MGVYNPQMKMPIGCHRCDYYDTCKTSNKSIGRYNAERCPDCPLVEMKTPHGRLIDEDNIKRSDAIKHFKAKAEHYRKRLARIEAQGDAICYDPTEQINGFKDEIAIYEYFVKELEDIPSAEKQGEWRKHDEERDYCSVCKHIFKTRTLTKQDKWTTYVDDLGYNYCPNCGCDMRGGSANER